MKTLFQIVLLFFCINSYGQKTVETKISKSKLIEAKSIHDLITEVPKDCKVNSFIFSANINGALKEFTLTGEGFSKEFQDLLKKAGKNNKLFFSDINSTCPKSHKKDYTLIVE